MSKFFVGQRVVAVKNHSQGMFRSGDQFTITIIAKKGCSCGVRVGVGIGGPDSMGEIYGCEACGMFYTKQIMEWLFHPTCFRPLDQLTQDLQRIQEEVILELV